MSFPTLTAPAEESHELFYTTTERFVIASVLIACIILTLVGNSIMLWSIRFVPALQTVNNVFLGSLCCANLINGLFTMPFIVNSMMSDQSPDMTIKKFWICTLSGFIDNGAMVGFIWTLTLLSIDRFILIQYPVWYKVQQNIMRAARLAFVTWIFSLLLVAPPIFGASTYRYSAWTFSCGIDPVGSAAAAPSDSLTDPSFIYFVVFCFVNSIVPIPVVLFSNLHILGVLLKTRRIRKETQAPRYRRSAMLMIALTSYLMLSLSPVFISSYMYIVNILAPDSIKMEAFPSMRILLSSHMLFLGNGAVTPIFFGLFNTSMRHKSTLVIQRQGSNLVTSLVRRFSFKFPGVRNFSHSSLSYSLRRMIAESGNEKRSSSRDDDISALTRLVVPGQRQEMSSNCCTQNGTQNTSLTDIGCSPFEYPSQRFVFPEPSSSEGLENELLRVWDEECQKFSSNVESRV